MDLGGAERATAAVKRRARAGSPWSRARANKARTTTCRSWAFVQRERIAVRTW